MGIEDPEADAVEQARPAAPDEFDPQVDDTVTDPGSLPLEADPTDVAEQRTVVPDDDGEGRDAR